MIRMRPRGLGIGDWVAVCTTAGLLLASAFAHGQTQEDFDKATACCWVDNPIYRDYCTPRSRGRCSTIGDFCESEAFLFLDQAFNKEQGVASLQCTVFGTRGDGDAALR